MKRTLLAIISVAMLALVSCADSGVDKNMPGGGSGSTGGNGSDDNVTYVDGLNYDTDEPNADKALTITFKASAQSPLFGYSGEVYLHTGVIVEGEWQCVPAEWNENLEKCQMSLVASGVWSLTMEPSIREWFDSEKLPIEKLGFVVRSKDGSLKGIDADSFVDVTDDKYNGFVAGDVVEKSMPSGLEYGINIINDTTVALVLYDKDRAGKSKDYAFVVGDFNNWTLANDPSSQMYRDSAKGVWWIEIGSLDPTREYAFQYYVGDESGTTRLPDAYAEKVLDPYNDQYIPSSTYNENLEYPKGGIGVVSVFKSRRDQFAWQSERVAIDAGELIIYELLLRDFSESGDIAGAIDKLDYLQSLGINAIELMPVQEFDGNDSWGYNPRFFFAMDKAYGTPTMYKEFIDECHKRGIAVILDVVYNHATGDCPLAKLYWDSSVNKTAANNPYFNVDAPHPYSVFHDFDHESELVKLFVKRNLQFLLNEYRFDGFRFDLTKGFSQRECNESNASSYDQDRIDILKGYHSAILGANPKAHMILEHFCDLSEEIELSKSGMMMWRNMNNAYCQTAMGYSSESDFSAITTYGSAMSEDRWVGFMESHDEERMGYKQTAYAKGALKSDLETRMKQLAVNAAFSLLVPGPKMIWQFGEMGYDYSINSNAQGVGNDPSNRTSRKPIRWEWLDNSARAGLVEEYSSLLALRGEYPELFEQSSLVEWHVGVSSWAMGRSISFATLGGKRLTLVGNFTSDEIASSFDLDDDYTWYDTQNGEKLEHEELYGVKIPAHSYRIFTNFTIE